jgi:RimJ/RimL family protein N-acetyltransferase
MTSGPVHQGMRASLRPLLDEYSPSDALASYYALHHAPDRTEILLSPEPVGLVQPAGFLVRARTGMDLFRPLVTFRATTEDAARDLLERGLPAGRPVYLTVPESLALWSNKYLSVTEADRHHIYRFNPQQYEPIINVLVTTRAGTDGHPRCEIRAGDRAGAVAGINWQSPRFAEVYVYTDPAVRGRGWGKSVVNALVGQILKSRRVPLYVVAETNEYSIRLAERVGFEDTGLREYAGQAVQHNTQAGAHG